jgi:hypothetical protein
VEATGKEEEEEDASAERLAAGVSGGERLWREDASSSFLRA